MTAAHRTSLVPLVPLYRLALGLRELRLRSGLEPVRRLGKPVVSIGSLSAGGAGKTPLTIALAHALVQRGLHVDVLSRGYGRRGSAAAPVDPEGSAEDFGDEPLLIAREAGVQVYVAAQRYQAGLLAEMKPSAGSGVHLLDDGFQHRQLHRDVNILLLDANDFLAERLLPAGNLREPLAAIVRATVIAIPVDNQAASLDARLRARGWQGPLWRLRRSIEVPPIEGPVVAFCGIARPRQFFAGLEAAGLQLQGRFDFADHHRYTVRDLERVKSAAHAAHAIAVITTKKDQVRLGKLFACFPESLPLHTANLRVEIEDEGAAIAWLEDRLAQLAGLRS